MSYVVFTSTKMSISVCDAVWFCMWVRMFRNEYTASIFRADVLSVRNISILSTLYTACTVNPVRFGITAFAQT